MSEQTPKKRGAPKKENKITQPNKLPIGYERYTVVLPVETINDIKNIAYWQRLSMKELAGEVFGKAVADFKANEENKALGYIKEDGSIKQRPTGA